MSSASHAQGAGARDGEVPTPDPLLKWISSSSELGQKVRDAVMSDGYVVLPGVLSEAECDREMARLWSFVEAVSPTVSRDDSASWYPAPRNESVDSSDGAAAAVDPWPHSGWTSLPDMMQDYQAGWLFSDLREILATRVFEPLYGTRELHCSKEGFTFHRPTAPKGCHPLVGKQGRFVCGRPSNTAGDHFDQRVSDPGLHCIQSSSALTDQGPDDGCFRCWPGSHKYHTTLMANKYRGNKDWVPLTDGELDELGSYGLSPREVHVRRGDVILWRSDLAHAGQAPRCTPSFRAVTYSCMLPAALTPAEAYPAKLDGYLNTQAGDHRPNIETGLHFSPPKRANGPEFGRYFKEAPALTWRQAELYGLLRYDKDDSNWIQSKLEAERLGVRFKDGARPSSIDSQEENP
eukprot:m.85199 g.85199  ORF g.85199 m.85199 type:complete len:405 (-) comp11367_c0_seq2:27-1241(-)